MMLMDLLAIYRLRLQHYMGRQERQSGYPSLKANSENCSLVFFFNIFSKLRHYFGSNLFEPATTMNDLALMQSTTKEQWETTSM